eukprot:5558229-Prymnesium_polylepis.1
MSFADELKQMAVFSTDGEDEERLKTYILAQVPANLRAVRGYSVGHDFTNLLLLRHYKSL